MIDLDSAADLSRAAQKAHDMIAAQIQAHPDGPIVAELQKLAADLQALSAEYAHMIETLERRIR